MKQQFLRYFLLAWNFVRARHQRSFMEIPPRTGRRRIDAERDTILNHVDEGLFIARFDAGGYVVGEHQSESVHRILGAYLTQRRSILEVFADFFDPGKMEEIFDFLALIARGKASDEMLRELNPLCREWVTVGCGDHRQKKVLSFAFKVIGQSGVEPDILIRFTDITQEIKAQFSTGENEAKSAAQSQVMLAMLHSGPALFQDFLVTLELEILNIREMLEMIVLRPELTDTFDRIGAEIHSLRGNAALLNLHALEAAAGRFEDIMILGGAFPEIDAEGIRLLMQELDNIEEKGNAMSLLLGRMRAFEHSEGDYQNALQALPAVVSGLAEKIAQRLGKKIKVVTTQVNFTGISDSSVRIMRDILVQLTRNAATHGIETPLERIRAGKSEYGLIAISMNAQGGRFCIAFRDDGKGLDFSAIQSRIVEFSGIRQEEIEKWSEAELADLVFEPRFTTARSSSTDAGRGMGMNIIRRRLNDKGGDIKINSARGQFCEFKLTIPLAPLQ